MAFKIHDLMARDHPIVADFLGMTLESAGHFKTTANTIETTLFEFKHNRIDAILLDLNLPCGNSTRLARFICVKWTCQQPSNHGRKALELLAACREKTIGYPLLLYFSLGDFVIHPDRPDWGVGQVQSIVGMNVTVSFEHAGKQMINCNIIALNTATCPTK